MRFLTWLLSENRPHPSERRCGHGPSRRRATVRPRLEVLEGRQVLSTLTVTSSLDGGTPGDGTLRGEIEAAQPGDTIVFDRSLQGQFFRLSAQQLEINENLTIQGPGASLLAILASGTRLFQVDAGANVTLSGLTIKGGTGDAYPQDGFNTPPPYDGYGGGILNLGMLTLSGCNVTQNGAYEGGGICNFGTMTLSGCTVTGNSAQAGGGIFNDTQGHLTILSSVVKNNTASDGPDICNLGSITISKDSSIGSKVSRR